MPSLPQYNTLQEARPDSISDLFNRDPEKLTDSDLDRIVAEMRANRERYDQLEKDKPRKEDRVTKKEINDVLKAVMRSQPNIKGMPSI
jgi:hypothetical protein